MPSQPETPTIDVEIAAIDAGRRPPPQMNPFRPFVTTELRRRKRTPSYTVTPFVRMVSCLESPAAENCRGPAIQSYRYFTLGLSGYLGTGNLFDITYGRREVVGYAYRGTGRTGFQVLIDTSQLPPIDFHDYVNDHMLANADGTLISGTLVNDHLIHNDEAGRAQIEELTSSSLYMQGMQSRARNPAGGAHPMPGITNVSIRRFTDGAGIEAVVSWKCFNRQQLEFLRHHFMMAGTYIVLEWGHEFANKQPTKTLNYLDPNITRELANCAVKGRKYTIAHYVAPNDGNYDFLVGAVSNFTVQYDAPTNTYNCTTTLVTSGEYLWGLSIPATFTDPNGAKISTFEEFFKQDGPFDAILGSTENVYSTNPGRVAGPAQVPSSATGDVPEGTHLENMSKNPHDYQFVSWKFFTQDIIGEMLKSFEDTVSTGSFAPAISKEISGTLRLITTKEEISGPPAWIGNNVYLMSTDIENMILVQSNMSAVPEDFAGGGFFGDGSDFDDRGLLNQGVWLNTAMIRRCFLESSTLEQAFKSILLVMNNSIIGYWQLMLFWDENEASYRVIDNKFAMLNGCEVLPANQKIYKFNVNTVGECLEVSLDSAYPPEIVTQLSLVARLKSTPGAFAANIAKYPMFGLSAHWAMAMNWTNYLDLVYAEIRGQREVLDAAKRPVDVGVPTITTSAVTGPIPQQGSPTPTNRDSTGTGDGVVRPTGPAPAAPPAAPPLIATRTERVSVAPVNRPAVAPVQFSPSVTAEVERTLRPGGFQGTPNISGAGIRVTQKMNDKLVQISNVLSGLNPPFFARLNSGYRSQAEQDRILADFRAGPHRSDGIFTPSLVPYPHGSGLAIDLVPTEAMYPGEDKGTSTTRPPGYRAALAKLTNVMGRFGFVNQGRNDDVHWNATSEDMKTEATRELAREAPAVRASLQGLAPYHGVHFAPGQSNEAIDALEASLRDIRWKFGDGLLALVNPNITQLRNLVMKDGLARHGSDIINGFIAPFPTTAKVDITFQGVSGISIFDVFSVDKLPYIYDQFGIFHITQINDTISSQGWRTQLHGVFRFMYFDPTKAHLSLLSKTTY